MKRLTVFILIALLLLSSFSEGADWKLITQNQEEHFYLLIDQDSIRRISDSTMHSWVMYEYREYLQGKREYDCRKCSPKKTLSHANALKEFDCSETKSRTITLTEYYVDEEPYTEQIDSDWKYFAPDSIDGILLQYVCIQKRE